MTEARKPVPGWLNLYDASLGIWEEPNPNGGLPVDYERDFARRVFKPLRGFLRRRGWTVEPDPNGKNFKAIAKWMWQGNHGDLRLRLHLGGRHIELCFYQEIVHENPNGGQYDFSRFLKMPYLIRKRFTAETRALIEYLVAKHAYTGPKLAGSDGQPLASRIEQTCRYGAGIRPTQDPLAAFNDGWDGEYEKKRGTHRFERDETGWPTRHEITYGNAGGRDREGVYVEPGSVRYWIDYYGHIMRGRAYPNMNSMCVFVYGPDRWTQVGSWDLFTPSPAESLRKMKGRGAATTLKRLLAQAAKDQAFEKAIIYRDLLKRAQPGQVLQGVA
jgi:hypothetical protein